MPQWVTRSVCLDDLGLESIESFLNDLNIGDVNSISVQDAREFGEMIPAP